MVKPRLVCALLVVGKIVEVIDPDEVRATNEVVDRLPEMPSQPAGRDH